MSRSTGAIYDILSGRRKGFWAGLLRFLLFFLSYPYRVAVAMRNRLYDYRLWSVGCLDCKVISVGNLTVGGTGKTPLVESIARHLRNRDVAVAIVSRGYRGGKDAPNDEKLLLAENLPDVPHVAGKDRVMCGRRAERQHGAQVVLMDDGFQHRRLGRDLDIVTIDATNPFGFGHALPRGLLRESPRSLERADVVVLTRSALAAPEELGELEREISRLSPEALIVHAEEQVVSLQDLTGDERAPDALGRTRAVAFCGIGNPDSFRQTVLRLGVDLSAFLIFDDHHHYTANDLEAIDAAASAENAEVLLTTQKDRVKLPTGFHWKHDLLVVKIEMHITQGREAFWQRIDEVIEPEETDR